MKGAVGITTSIILMEGKAIMEALHDLKENKHRRAVILTYLTSTLQKVQKEIVYTYRMAIISDCCLECLDIKSRVCRGQRQ